MKGHGAKFNRKMEDAIAALLTKRTVEEAAAAVGISVSTLLRWQKDPAFDAPYRQAKRAAFGQAIARLHQLSGIAVSALGKVLVDQATPPSTRVRAADSIINHTMKAVELQDVEARVAELERAAEAAKDSRR
jgi:hypothetical protein